MEDKYTLRVTFFESRYKNPTFSADVTDDLDCATLIGIVQSAVISPQDFTSHEQKVADEVKDNIKKYQNKTRGWYFTHINFENISGKESFFETSGYFKQERENVRLQGELPYIDYSNKKTLFRKGEDCMELEVIVGIGSK